MAQIKIDKIERSKRKTVALLVTSDATLVVKAPYLMPKISIDKLVDKKQSWIKRKVREMNSRPKAPTREFVNGEGFLYLGKNYRLKIGNFPKVSFGEHLFFPKDKKSTIREELTDWYKSQAEKKFRSRSKWYAKKLGVEYSSIRLSTAQKRWGSCGRNNSLSLNWRLIMAPLKVIDYVIVHELAHISEKNHSKKFWNIVRTTLSDFEKSRDWLKENGEMLRI